MKNGIPKNYVQKMFSLPYFVLFFLLVDGEWLDWQEWVTCSKPCGSGIRKRTRKCTTPKFGGKPCASEGLQTYEEEERCNVEKCKGKGCFYIYKD